MICLKILSIVVKIDELGKKLHKSVNRPCRLSLFFFFIQHSQLSKKQNLGPKIAKTIDKNDQQNHLTPSLINRVWIRRYRIAKLCDTISTNCYAFAQNASLKVRRFVFCENEWVIAPVTSVKSSCWSTFSKSKSSNFKAEKFVQLQHRSMIVTSKHRQENTYHYTYILGWCISHLRPVLPTSTHYIAHTTDTEEHNMWSQRREWPAPRYDNEPSLILPVPIFT